MFKGYRFYCPSQNTRIVGLTNMRFLENDLIIGSDKFKEICFEKDHYEDQPLVQVMIDCH